MRIFRDCEEMIKEIDRELLVCGISCPVKHYQNKKLHGEDQITKELIGLGFVIGKPLKKRDEMIKFVFGDEWEKIKAYCEQEHLDRVCGKPLNPGHSYKIRQDMWQKFMINDETAFDYTYSERIYWQIENVLEALKEDKHTRQAVIQVFQAQIDNKKFGGDTRIPCSVDWQFLIRNNRLNVIYHMRSNDYYGHFPIDIYLSASLMQYFRSRLLDFYPDLKTGALTYFAGSLHAYSWDLKEHVVF